MKFLMLLGGILYLAALGFWTMGKIDHFLDCGGFLPNREEDSAPEQELLSDQAEPASPKKP